MMTRRAMLALLACSADAFGAGHLLAQREAAAPRQAFRPSLSRALHRRRRTGRPHAADRLRRRRHEELHHRGRRVWRGVPRLRQRRLARPVRPERHPPGGRAAGHDQSPVQEQSRRHVHRCDGEGRADADRVGIGRHRRRLRQRRLRRPLHHLLRPQRALSQQRRRHVHRRDRESRPAPGRRALRLRLHLGGLRSRRPPRSVRRQLPQHHAREAAQAGREPRLPLEGRARELRSARPAHRVRRSCFTTTATARSPT